MFFSRIISKGRDSTLFRSFLIAQVKTNKRHISLICFFLGAMKKAKAVAPTEDKIHSWIFALAIFSISWWGDPPALPLSLGNDSCHVLLLKISQLELLFTCQRTLSGTLKSNVLSNRPTEVLGHRQNELWVQFGHPNVVVAAIKKKETWYQPILNFLIYDNR